LQKLSTGQSNRARQVSIPQHCKISVTTAYQQTQQNQFTNKQNHSQHAEVQFRVLNDLLHFKKVDSETKTCHNVCTMWLENNSILAEMCPTAVNRAAIVSTGCTHHCNHNHLRRHQTYHHDICSPEARHLPWFVTSHVVELSYVQTTTQPFYGPFSGTTRVSRCQNRTSGLYGTRED